MGILDSILSQVGGNADVQNLAAKVGLSPEHGPIWPTPTKALIFRSD